MQKIIITLAGLLLGISFISAAFAIQPLVVAKKSGDTYEPILSTTATGSSDATFAVTKTAQDQPYVDCTALGYCPKVGNSPSAKIKNNCDWEAADLIDFDASIVVLGQKYYKITNSNAVKAALQAGSTNEALEKLQNLCATAKK